MWESKQSVYTRVRNVLTQYLDHSKVMVVCHSMVIATLIAAISEEVKLCGDQYELTKH